MKICSGGQTGVDRAALDVALALGLPCGGWCPKGRMAEDGVIGARYALQETPSNDYAQRTEWNVRDSDGTLIVTSGAATGGTAFTIDCVRRYRKPHIVFDLSASEDCTHFGAWIDQHKIHTLNVAGPRESHAPGIIYHRARALLEVLLKNVDGR